MGWRPAATVAFDHEIARRRRRCRCGSGFCARLVRVLAAIGEVIARRSCHRETIGNDLHQSRRCGRRLEQFDRLQDQDLPHEDVIEGKTATFAASERGTARARSDRNPSKSTIALSRSRSSPLAEISSGARECRRTQPGPALPCLQPAEPRGITFGPKQRGSWRRPASSAARGQQLALSTACRSSSPTR